MSGKIKVSEDIKIALDGLIFKGDKIISERTKKKRIEGIIQCHSKYGHWNGYKQLNKLTLIELTEMLIKGYEAEPTLEEKLVKDFSHHKEIVKFYDGKKNLDKCEIEQYNFSRGYVAAYEKLLSGKVDLNKIKITK